MSLDQTVEGRSLTITAETLGGVTLSAKETVTADNVRGLYGGYGDNIVIENCTLTNSKSVINSQSVITSMAPEGSYNVQLIGITADIRADVQDKIYAIRLSGGRTLIEDCDITMTEWTCRRPRS